MLSNALQWPVGNASPAAGHCGCWCALLHFQRETASGSEWFKVRMVFEQRRPAELCSLLRHAPAPREPFLRGQHFRFRWWVQVLPVAAVLSLPQQMHRCLGWWL